MGEYSYSVYLEVECLEDSMNTFSFLKDVSKLLSPKVVQMYILSSAVYLILLIIFKFWVK